ncbi:MAG: protein kinase, partial [Acidobacteriota bacterium]
MTPGGVGRYAPRMLEPGKRLGHYEILGTLGAGGMGEVYRARDAKLDRDVAVKVLPPEVSRDPDRVARFQREARAASALNHPNILHVYDIGHEGDTFFLVMELVEGSTLRDLLAEGPLPPRRLLEIGEQIAAGLAKAHAAGIVHRDLKPENVMVTGDGLVKILDFGLAKLNPAQDGSSSQMATALATGSGVVLGTASYMSPEQARGRPVAFESDQFSLGTVLYEMGSGRRPFSGESFVQILNGIIEDEPEPLLRTNPKLPQPLGWIVARCLAKEPAERYAATVDLARDLRSLRENLSDLTQASLTTTAPEERSRRRAGGGRGLAIGLVAGLAVGAAAMAWLAPRLFPPPPPPELRALSFSGADGMADASPDGRTLAFVSLRGGRSRIWLKQLADGSEIALTGGEDLAPRFSPDGSSVLFVHEEGHLSYLYRISAFGGEPRRVLADAMAGAWSPDGRSLAFIRYTLQEGTTVSQVGIADADGGGERILAEVPRRALEGPRFSPDGHWIAVVGGGFGNSEGRDEILLVRPDGSEVRGVPTPGKGGDVSAVAWLLGSRKVVYIQGESQTNVALGTTTVSSGAGRLLLHDLFSGDSRVLLWTPNLAFAVDVVDDGEVVFDAITATQNLQEYVLADGTGASPRALSQGGSLDRQPIYTPDGKWIVYSSNRTGNLDIWARSLEEGSERRLTDHEDDDWDPGFLPDGRLIFTSRRTGNFEIWLAEPDGSGARQVSHDGFNAENATPALGGEWLVYNSGNPEHSGLWKVRLDGTEATQLVEG